MAAPALTVVQAPLADLRPHPGNPRTITPARLEQLKRTLQAERSMLDARPLIALPDGTVIAGNQRLAAAVALGWDTIPTVYADLDQEQRTRWMLLDNRPFGEDDETAVAVLLAELEQAGADLDLTGYTAADSDRMLRALTASERDPDETPAAPDVAKSVRGQVYELGAHRVMCGDATSETDVAILMDGKKAAIVFTDPPYGVEYTGGLKKREALDGDERGTDIYERSVPLMVTHAAKKASFYIWYADLTIAAAAAAAAAAGLAVRCQIIWSKNHAQFMSSAHYHGKHEPCMYAARRNESAAWYGPKNEVTVWEHDRAASNDLHPTQKPTALAERALANSSQPDDIVLDSFAGSGSTLIAAEQIGRRCFAMEIDPVYVDVIRQRYADYTGQPEYAP